MRSNYKNHTSTYTYTYTTHCCYTHALLHFIWFICLRQERGKKLILTYIYMCNVYEQHTYGRTMITIADPEYAATIFAFCNTIKNVHVHVLRKLFHFEVHSIHHTVHSFRSQKHLPKFKKKNRFYTCRTKMHYL